MFKIILLLTLPFLPLLADNLVVDKGSGDLLLKEEIALLSNLIESTQESLQKTIHIKELLLDYQIKLAHYLKNGDDRESAMRVAKVAILLLEEIKEQFLTDLFDPDFLSELTVFAQLGQRKGLPKPSSL